MSFTTPQTVTVQQQGAAYDAPRTAGRPRTAMVLNHAYDPHETAFGSGAQRHDRR